MGTNHTVCLFLLLLVHAVFSIDEDTNGRDEKLISTFQIVRFPNDVCIGSNSRNGTCYTSAECSDKSGTSSGSCADGFGVCCTFIISTCGQSSSENITYWTNPTTSPGYGECTLDICAVSDDICSIRLDFTSFTITGPSTHSVANQVGRLMGSPVGHVSDISVIKGSSWATLCLTDVFSVSGSSPSNAPPAICGSMLTGTHMYVPADVDRCNMLNFFFADNANAGATELSERGVQTLATRVWDMTISQIECTSTTLPPAGCTQFYYGSGVATITSFNWKSTTVANTNTHLGMQHQRICIRRERGKCTGCFATTALGLAISGLADTPAVHSMPAGCCGYASGITLTGIFGGTTDMFDDVGIAAAGTTQVGFDCIIIPGAFGPANHNSVPNEIDITQASSKLTQTLANTPNADLVPTPWPPQICGSNAGLGIGAEDLYEAVFEGALLTWGETGEDFTADVNMANGNAAARNVSICTRNNPFILEFLSDDLDGLGSTAADAENSSATQLANQGFTITHAQLDCA